MANVIDFKTGVDEWYRNQSKDNAWSNVLNSLNKAYAKVNYVAGKSADAINRTALDTAQASASSLYTSYKANKKTLGNVGFSETFKSAVGKRLGQNLGIAGQAAYQSALSDATTTAETADVTDNAIYQAYEQQVAGVASTWENILGYFNLDSENQTSVDYASQQGLMTNGELTAKGKAYLKYYMNKTEFGADTSDEYYLNKGTLNKYLQENVKGNNPDWLSAVSEMAGVDLSSPVFSASEKAEYLGKDTKTIKLSEISTDFDVSTDNPNKYKDIFTYLFNSSKKDDVLAGMKKSATGYTTNGGEKTYIFNDKTTAKLMGRMGVKEEDMTFNGISFQQALQMGLLEEGSTFTKKGMTFIIQDGKARFYSTLNK